MSVNWLFVALGIWLIASPWVLGFAVISLAKWNSVIAGLILVLVNVWIMFDTGDSESRNVETDDPNQRS